MRKIATWALALGLMVAGFGLAACGPEQDLDSGVRICVTDGEPHECKGKR